MENFWLNIEDQAGTLEYAKAIQREVGGEIKNEEGWYWVE